MSRKHHDYKKRILSKIRHNGECWEWLGEMTRDGYGRMFYRGRKLGAYRVAYLEFVGPIPEGLHLDHLCRNRACVNPAHVEPVTPLENTMRGDTPAAKNKAKTHCPVGHPYDEVNTDFKGGNGSRRCRECHRAKQRLRMREKYRRDHPNAERRV